MPNGASERLVADLGGSKRRKRLCELDIGDVLVFDENFYKDGLIELATLLVCADEKIEVTLDRTNEVGGEPLRTIGIHWVMPVWPTWQLGAHMTDPKLFFKISIERNNYVMLTVLPVL